jgi:hypothetical protein
MVFGADIKRKKPISVIDLLPLSKCRYDSTGYQRSRRVNGLKAVLGNDGDQKTISNLQRHTDGILQIPEAA